MMRFGALGVDLPSVVWRGRIFGEPASKANSRRMRVRTSKAGNRFLAPAKSLKATAWKAAAALQIFPPLVPVDLDGDVGALALVTYADRRSDVDIELLWDVLQAKRVVENDRSIRQKIVIGEVGETPGVEVLLWRL